MPKNDEEILHKPHDKGYKYLLSTKRLFIQLMRSFVKQGWAERLEQEDIELVDKSFILQDFKDKEADLVYKIKMNDNYVYFYLLELQSSVDYQMPYRLLLYMVEIWRMVIKDAGEIASQRKRFKLPVIVPCVLYNGINNWTAKTSFRETLMRYEEFDDFVLDFKYILFDVKRYKDKDLLEMANVIGTVFFIDKTKENSEELLERLRTVATRTQEMPEEDINVLWVWLKNIASKDLTKDTENEIEEIFQKRKKVEDMEHAIERILRKERMEAAEEAKKEGIEAGIEIEKIKVIKNLIKQGAEMAFIIKVTELTEEEIIKVKESL